MNRKKSELKVPRINISKVDLKSFAPKDMKIDPYWDDLINAGTKKKRS